jgi:hypothetical protein
LIHRKQLTWSPVGSDLEIEIFAEPEQKRLGSCSARELLGSKLVMMFMIPGIVAMVRVTYTLNNDPTNDVMVRVM